MKYIYTMNQVTPDDLLAYIQSHSNDDAEDIDLDTVSDYFIFEAVSEKIVELNPELRVEKMAESYTNVDMSMSSFAEKKLDHVLHPDCYNYFTEKERDKWIEYSVKGMVESNVLENV